MNNCFVVLLGNTPLPAMFSCDTWDCRTGRVMYGLEGLTGVYYDVQDSFRGYSQVSMTMQILAYHC